MGTCRDNKMLYLVALFVADYNCILRVECKRARAHFAIKLQLDLNQITYEGIDGLEAGLHGLVHGLAGDNAGSLKLNSLSLVGLNWALAIDGLTEGVDNATKHTVANRDVDNGTGSLNDIAFLNFSANSRLAHAFCG